MNFEEKIAEETKNVEIEIKNIAPHEWGEYFDGIEDYKNLQIKFGDDLLHITLSYTEDLADKFCEEINSIWGDDRNPFYRIDLTGFWLEFPNDWDEEFYAELYEDIFDEIKEIAIKYYLLAKYDKASYRRRGFDIYEFLGVKR